MSNSHQKLKKLEFLGPTTVRDGFFKEQGFLKFLCETTV